MLLLLLLLLLTDSSFLFVAARQIKDAPRRARGEAGGIRDPD